jgi:hypothetical protein
MSSNLDNEHILAVLQTLQAHYIEQDSEICNSLSSESSVCLRPTPENEDSASFCEANNCDRTRHSQIWKVLTLNHQLAHLGLVRST